MKIYQIERIRITCITTKEKENLFIHVQHQKIVQNRCNYFHWVNILGHIHFINNF